MARELFYVLREGASGRSPRWIVRKGREIYGEYLNESAATLDAIEAAQDAGSRGDEAHVVVDDGIGCAHLEWSSLTAPVAGALAAALIRELAPAAA